VTAATMNVNAVRGAISTWPGRIVVIFLAALLVGGTVMVVRGNTGGAAVTYRTAEVTKGTISQLVAISGSVNPAGQARLNFRSSGRLSAILVTVGQQVTAGQELARIEATDLENALANAKSTLANAESGLQRQYQTQADAQRSLDNARRSASTDVANAEAALAKIRSNFSAARSNYESLTAAATSDIASFQTSLGTIESQVDALIFLMGQIVGGGDTGDLRNAYNALTSTKTPALQNARANSVDLLTPALSEYQSARSASLSLVADFEAALAAGGDTTAVASSYQLAQTNLAIALSRLTGALDTTSSVLATVQTGVATAQASLNTPATRGLHDPFDKWRADLATLYKLVTGEQQRVSTLKVKLTQSTSSTNTLADAINGSYVSAIQNVSATIERTRQTVQSAESALASKPADIQSAQNSVASAQLAVQTAQANLENATLRAPSAGVVQAINGTVGEPASGSTTTPVVLLANTGTIQLHGTVGEADVSKLKLGQVARITIDALGDTRMTGKVTGIDPVATIQQGVPVYGVDITIDIASAGVRPGMSGTANVILATRQDVLTVPNLAIKTQAGRRYVQVLQDGQPVDVAATFGISNDTVTEITGGDLKEGDQVVLPQPRTGATAAPAGGNRLGGAIPAGGQQIIQRP
jgi:multidrug efflux pump subunit AcrA (membrane-fusion protein)